MRVWDHAPPWCTCTRLVQIRGIFYVCFLGERISGAGLRRALVENLFDRTETGRGRRPQHRRRYDGRACDLRRNERMLATRRRRAVEVAVLDERLARAARAERRGGARGAGVEVSDADRANA